MGKKVLKLLSVLLVRLLELPFAIINGVLVILLTFIFLMRIRTVDRANKKAKSLHRSLEKLEGKVEWKKRKRNK